MVAEQARPNALAEILGPGDPSFDNLKKRLQVKRSVGKNPKSNVKSLRDLFAI